MDTSSTTTNSDILSLAQAGQAKLDQAVEAVRAAKKHVEDQEKEYEESLREALRDKVILFTGWLEAEDMFGQDGIEMYESHDRLQDERLVVTSLFVTEKRFSAHKTPLVYAKREGAYRSGRSGGRVSFRLLEARKCEVVE